jgi:hypothetical protein
MEGVMPAPDEFMQQINAQKVSAPLLGKIMHLWASLPGDEWRDFDRRLERVVELVAGEHGGDGSPMLAMAVALRLMALDALVLDPEFRGWLIIEHAPEGITYIHGDLLQIAAVQTVLEGPDGEPAFDRNSFRECLMELITAKGRA